MIPPLGKIKVSFAGREVGTIAKTGQGLYPFEYADSWIAEGFSISPLSLPLQKKVFMPSHDPLEGMFGVFGDSLPDGWGRLLVDRMLRSHGEDPAALDGLTRLSIVGEAGMGALAYEPVYQAKEPMGDHGDLDALAKECKELFSEGRADNLDELFLLGGSSGGARPKILTKVDGEDWIIKFPTSRDRVTIGEQEYRYALCAQACSIDMPEVRLFQSKVGPGYFGVKRFDRSQDGGRVHMASAAGLLETTHRIPNLDYGILVRLTLKLTDDMSEVKRLYRLMCFNVFSHNRDDHSKNFSYLYDEGKQVWKLSPAYDLTFNQGFNGEHATTVAGNGIDPGLDDVLSIARDAGLSRTWARATAEEIRCKTHDELRCYW